MLNSEDLTIRLLSLALDEDVGKCDITSHATIPEKLQLSGSIYAKENGRIAGLAIVKLLFERHCKDVALKTFLNDGEPVSKGERILQFEGPGRSILSMERLVLNILQRMSGIATQTAHFVERIRGTKATILDTRKTAPGNRALDKLAVRLGGGTNHRQGLSDAYLIKENHITAAGGLEEAVRRVQNENSRKRLVELEVRSLPELKEALTLTVDRILLDNMSIQEMKAAVDLVHGKIPLEASGNISLENVRQVAETGVDFISVGSLTHSVHALDLSLMIENTQPEGA